MTRATASTTRARGRPTRPSAPQVPWDAVEHALVFGETLEPQDGSAPTRNYPSYGDLAKKYRVSKSRIGQFATKKDCLRRRAESEVRERTEYERKMVEKRAELRAVSVEKEIEIIDDFLLRFAAAVENGEMRFDNPADFDRLVRLKQYRLGGADSRQEVHAGISLEEIQARTRALRDQMTALDSAVAGAVTTEDQIEAADAAGRKVH